MFNRPHKITCSNHTESFHSVVNKRIKENGATTLREKVSILMNYSKERLLHILNPPNHAIMEEYYRAMKMNIPQGPCKCTKEMLNSRKMKFGKELVCNHQILKFKFDAPELAGPPPIAGLTIDDIISSTFIEREMKTSTITGESFERKKYHRINQETFEKPIEFPQDASSSMIRALRCILKELCHFNNDEAISFCISTNPDIPNDFEGFKEYMDNLLSAYKNK